MKGLKDREQRSLFTHNLGRGLKIIIYLLALWCFTATTLTQIFPPLLIFVFFCLIVLSWFKERLGILHSGWLWHPLTLLVLLFSFAYFMYDPGISLLLLLNYLTINKLFNLWATRDYAQLIVINFFQILLTSAITSSITFAFLFSGYIILLLSSLILLNCQRDYITAVRVIFKRLAQTSPATLPTGNISQEKLFRFLRPLFTSVFFYWVVILLLMIQFFILLPRLAGAPFIPGFLHLQREIRSGFSDEVMFEGQGGINLDPTIVMRIQILTAETDAGQPVKLSAIRIRGTALDYFDGRRWHLSSTIRKFYRQTFPRNDYELEPLRLRQGGINVSQRIVLEPSHHNYLFAVDTPIRFSFSPYRVPLLLNTETLSAHLLLPRKSAFTYEATSYVDPTPGGIISHKIPAPYLDLSEDRLDNLAQLYFNLPPGENTAEIKKLAETITQGENSALAAAIKIERYLQTNYTYTLERAGADVTRPVSDFLFNTRQGHCELFSSAMCCLLRSLGIPARLVIGYYTDEWNSFGEYFIVRESNAHTWVEAWMEGYGWLTFDPTPPQALPFSSFRGNLFASLSHLLDSLRLKWYRYVIDYDLSDQLRVNELLGRNLNILFLRTGVYLNEILFLRSPQPTNRLRIFALIMMGIFIIISVVIVLQSVLSYRGWTGIFSRLFHLLKGERQDKKLITLIYLRVVKRLRKIGYKPQPGQTPWEFALRVSAQNQQLRDFLQFTQIYYHLRFGDYSLSAEDSQFISHLFTTLSLPAIKF